MRVKRILTESHPKVANFDQDEWNKEHYDPNEPFKKIVADFRSGRRKLIALLRKSKDKDWENWAILSERKSAAEELEQLVKSQASRLSSVLSVRRAK